MASNTSEGITAATTATTTATATTAITAAIESAKTRPNLSVRAAVNVPAETDAIIDTFATAFMRDPLSKFVNPDPVVRKKALTGMFKFQTSQPDIWIDVAESTNTGAIHGAAIWSVKTLSEQAPKQEEGKSDTKTETIELAITANSQQEQEVKKQEEQRPKPREDIAKFFNIVEAAGPPKPYTYLAFLGSAEAGSGAGTALLKNGFARLAKGTQLVLWTQTAENATYYEKFGFSLYSRVLPEEAGIPVGAWWMIKII
ncbi:hypothetical protein HK100_003032 [Physocladia obscura]|uniref:N-acetyltransferase domain-containing protein n=1 Tax=Physocladia obscura TaxID=109957 RepID=A0AAD5XDF8_9FUNG|nr:hypothetical protein HK100_003032 [Physocladia obscura]